MSAPVYIAGLGVISSIGNNTAENLEALQKGEAGMGPITYLETAHRGKLPVAEVKMANQELAHFSKLSDKLSRTALLSTIAAKEALNDAALENFSSLRTGFISANTVGGMDKTENFFTDFYSDRQKGRLKDVVNHECGAVTEITADALGIRNHVSTVSTACSSSANSIFLGARLIKQGILDAVIAGGVDALTRFTLNGFGTLMILDQAFCKPFDENRKGLNLGEGAGYVLMVSEKVAASLRKSPYGQLSGFANANDAYHQTASSPDGTGSYMAMKNAMDLANISPSQIDYINLHGTGTQNNDIAEGTAIKRLFEPRYPKMSSTKSFTGHTLGASGGIEAVYSCLAIKHGMIFPNLRFETQIKELPFAPETQFLKNQKVNHVLSNSFGFGGNCSSLLFSAC
jgi:3-oxoacyl-(acyl-carrier-protein) synthase